MKIYIFHRMHNMQMMFYPVQYENDDDARKGAELNEGTLYVTTQKGDVVWPKVGVTQH